MKKITLKVVKQCVGTDGVEPEYIRTEVMPEFFKNFWVRRMALDRRNYNQLVETTLEIALKVGASEIIGRVVEDLKDESEPYRRMVMETITKVIEKLGPPTWTRGSRSFSSTASSTRSRSRRRTTATSCSMALAPW